MFAKMLDNLQLTHLITKSQKCTITHFSYKQDCQPSNLIFHAPSVFNNENLIFHAPSIFNNEYIQYTTYILFLFYASPSQADTQSTNKINSHSGMLAQCQHTISLYFFGHLLIIYCFMCKIHRKTKKSFCLLQSSCC
jgi:hypothetical protein